MNAFELPCLDRCKSFYGKAKAIEYDDGTKELKSYDTIVCRITPAGEIIRLWAGYSATTMRHINSFLSYYGYPGPNYGGKAFWDARQPGEIIKL